jgi:hypothetical protein
MTLSSHSRGGWVGLGAGLNVPDNLAPTEFRTPYFTYHMHRTVIQ